MRLSPAILPLALAWLSLAGWSCPPALAQPALQRGTLLVASDAIDDPRFARSVILITRHDSDGSMGVILNRPTPIRLADALPQIEALAASSHRIHYGGPVEMQRLYVLLRSETPPAQASHIFSRTYLSDLSAVLDQLRGEPNDAILVFMGYAGWAPGQLQGELRRGDWQLQRGNEQTIFEQEPATLWEELHLPPGSQWVWRHDARWMAPDCS